MWLSGVETSIVLAGIASIRGFGVVALNGQPFVQVNGRLLSWRVLYHLQIVQSHRLAGQRAVLQYTAVLLPNCFWLHECLCFRAHELITVVVLALQNEV